MSRRSKLVTGCPADVRNFRAGQRVVLATEKGSELAVVTRIVGGDVEVRPHRWYDWVRAWARKLVGR